MSGKSPLESDPGTASNRENLTGPQETGNTEDRLQQVDLRSRGEFLEDEQRDRDSNGTGRYDDSIARRRGEGEGEDRLGISRGD